VSVPLNTIELLLTEGVATTCVLSSFDYLTKACTENLPFTVCSNWSAKDRETPSRSDNM